ncbi:Sushi, von Willebrand factor type A, EGF and pentraxin domain-containing protein 1, partial [Geodia barretti]
PALSPPQNGRVSVIAQTVDSIAIYSCNEGFSLEGEATRTCIDIGEGLVIWTGQEPTCVPIRCPRLPAPANGRVVAPVRTVGSQASYSCSDGYRLSGASTRVCQSNSEWSGQEPRCVLVDCGRLADIPRGRVEVTTTTFLSTATYVCDSGFSIEGTSVRTCLATGVWSGREPTCTPSTCGSLDNPSNGQVTIAGTGIGATATYSCNTGYIFRGVVSRVCQANGQWSGSAPTCEVVTCSDLPAPTNGDVQVTGFEFTSTATYVCDSGYVLVG